MAITVLQHPGYNGSLHSPLWHMAASSNFFQPDFRYIFDIYIGTAGGSTFITTLKAYMDDTAYGVIDVSRIIRAYLQNYFAPVAFPAPFAIKTDNIIVFYGIDYGEEYGSGGVITEYHALTTEFYGGLNAYSEDMPTPGLGYAPLASSGYSWITSRDITAIKMPVEGTAFLSFYNNPAQDWFFDVQELDADGAPVGLIALRSLLNTCAEKLLVLNLNYNFINSAYAVGPISNLWAGYRIRLVSSDGISVIGDWANVMFMCEPKIAATPVHFLNRYGGFDTMYFAGPTRKNLDINRKTFQRQGIVRSAAGGTPPLLIGEFDVNTGVYADTVIPYNTQHVWNRKLSSGYLSDTDRNWLWELIASPQIYLTNNNGSYFPVTIKTDKWAQMISRFDKMQLLEVELTSTRQVTSQSR